MMAQTCRHNRSALRSGSSFADCSAGNPYTRSTTFFITLLVLSMVAAGTALAADNVETGGPAKHLLAVIASGLLLGSFIPGRPRRRKATDLGTKLEFTVPGSGAHVWDAYRQSQDRFKSVFDHSPMAMALVDPNGYFLETNQRFQNMFGYEERELRSMTFIDLTHMDDIQKTLYGVEELLEGRREHFEMEKRYVPSKGRVLWCLTSVSVVRNAKGEVQYMIAMIEDITERRLAEERLEESQRTLSTLMSNLPGMAYRCSNDREWTMQFVSEGCRELTGYEAEELLDNESVSFNDLIHPEDRSLVWIQVQSAVERRESYRFIYRIIRADGKIRWVWEQGVGVYDEAGRPGHLEGFISDVTDRKQVETLLAGEREILEMIANAHSLERILKTTTQMVEEILPGTFCSILLLDEDGRHLRHGAAPSLPQAYNEAIDGLEIGPDAGCCGTAAYRREMVIVEDIATDPLCDKYRDLARRHGIRACWSLPIHDSEGALLGTFALYDRRPRKPTTGEVRLVKTAAYLAGIAIERRRAEKALMDSEAKFTQFADNLKEIIWMASPDFSEVYYVSPSLEEICGISCASVYQDSGAWTKLIHPEDRPRLEAEFSAKLRRKCTQEFRIIRPDGTIVWLRDRAMPIRGKSGRIAKIAGILEDVTERKMAEERECELCARLARSERMESLGLLAGGVSHDLNNILSPVLGYPDLIKDLIPAESEAIEYVQDIRSAAEKAAALTQDLLVLSRGASYETAPLQLNETISSFLSSATYRDLKTRLPGVVLETAMDPELPLINGSDAHLLQVLMNLIINAFEAISSDGKVTVKTALEKVSSTQLVHDTIERGRYVVLRISDTGRGIAPNDIDKIFEPFFTKKSLGRSGTGLGLAIVYRVLRDHGAYIDVSSKVNEGTTFSVYFTPVRKRRRPPVKNHSQSAGTESVLVIDNGEDGGRLTSKLLASLGYKVTVSNAADLALRRLRETSFDLVVMEINENGDFAGLGVYDEIRRIRAQQRTMVIGCYGETSSIREARRRGVNVYLEKPFTRDNLGAAARRALDAPCR